jgi:hypothetical protein
MRWRDFITLGGAAIARPHATHVNQHPTLTPTDAKSIKRLGHRSAFGPPRRMTLCTFRSRQPRATSIG